MLLILAMTLIKIRPIVMATIRQNTTRAISPKKKTKDETQIQAQTNKYKTTQQSAKLKWTKKILQTRVKITIT